jgi:hypothetical protein
MSVKRRECLWAGVPKEHVEMKSFSLPAGEVKYDQLLATIAPMRAFEDATKTPSLLCWGISIIISYDIWRQMTLTDE